ncbi:hypothetical protein GF373_03865, partial [bacterium]|nr:hypothetical protein [bacterium]
MNTQPSTINVKSRESIALLSFRFHTALLCLVWTIVVLMIILGWYVFAAQAESIIFTLFGFGGIWVAGLAGIFYETKVYQRQMEHQFEVKKEVEELRHYNEMILHYAGEGIMGVDLAGQVTFINPAGAEMLDFTMEFLIGKFIHPLI